MPKLLNLFFDLDGTLTDPEEGITKCLRYSLENLGRPYPSGLQAQSFIGPPLRYTFASLLGSADEPLIEKAIGLYRERFAEVGLFENSVYPGIAALLSALHASSLKLCVVTTKPTVYANRIVEHFGLAQWFTAVFGTDLNGRFDKKAELIEFILSDLKLNPLETIMIGDTPNDILAGQANRLKTLAVTYGFGSLPEIIAAKPDYICASPAEIQTTVMEP